MMKINVNKNEFLTFLDYCRLKGVKPDGKESNLLNNFVLEIKEDKIRMSSPDGTSSCFIEVEMPITIETPGELPIGDVDEFIKYIRRMGSELSISFDDRLIVLEDGVKRAEFPAIAEGMEIFDMLPYSKEDGVYKTFQGSLLNTIFEINSTYLNDVIKDSNLIGVRLFPIEVMEEEIKVKVGEPRTSMITTRIPALEIKGEPCESTYSLGFGNIFSMLEGHIRIHISEQAPLIVENIDTTLITFKAMVAPYS